MEFVYGVFHGRRIVWSVVVGLICLLLPFFSGMVAREVAAQTEKTQPVMAEFWDAATFLL